MNVIKEDLSSWWASKRIDFLRDHTKDIDNHIGFRMVQKPFKAWKYTHAFDNHIVIVELLIPSGATIYIGQYEFTNRCYPHNWGACDRKMRADKALVVRQYKIDVPFNELDVDINVMYGARVNGPVVESSHSDYDEEFIYETGKQVVPSSGFSKLHKQCSGGIHFFLEQSDALAYAE